MAFRSAFAELETTAATATDATVRFSLFPIEAAATAATAAGADSSSESVATAAAAVPIATATSAQVVVPAAAATATAGDGGGETVTASAQLKPPAGAVKQWSTKHPQTYSVLAEVLETPLLIMRHFVTT
jgi:hypothetical protein